MTSIFDSKQMLWLVGWLGLCLWVAQGNEGWGAETTQTVMTQIQQKRNMLKQMETRKQEIQLHLKESYVAEQDVHQKLKQVSEEMEQLQTQIVQITQQQQLAQQRLSEQSATIARLKHQLEANQYPIEQRIRSIYKLLRAEQAPSKSTHYLKILLRHEMQALADLQHQQEALGSGLEPSQQTDHLQQKLYQEKTQLKQLLEQKQQAQERLLITIQQDQQVYYRYLEELQQSMEAVSTDLDYFEKQQRLAQQFQVSPGLKAWKRKISLPVDGKVISSFETKRSTKQSAYRGILLETAERAFVSAVAPGHVVFAEVLEGYQQLVIVDHGKESFSVYGNLAELKIEEGTYVDTGDPIGIVGADPVSGKSQAYFEIRDRGKSVNPRPWLKK